MSSFPLVYELPDSLVPKHAASFVVAKAIADKYRTEIYPTIPDVPACIATRNSAGWDTVTFSHYTAVLTWGEDIETLYFSYQAGIIQSMSCQYDFRNSCIEVQSDVTKPTRYSYDDPQDLAELLSLHELKAWHHVVIKTIQSIPQYMINYAK